MSSYRDLLAFTSGELVQAGRLNAMQYAMGRTRMLGAGIEGQTFLQDKNPPTFGGEFKDLTQRAGYVRSGKIYGRFYARQDPLTGIAFGTDSRVLVLRHSDSAVLAQTALMPAFESGTFTVTTQEQFELDVPTDEDVRIVLRMYIQDDAGGRVFGEWKDFHVFEVPTNVAVAMNAWEESTAGPFHQEAPIVSWVHANEGKSTGTPANFNDPNVEYPKAQLLVCDQYNKVHLSSHNGGPEYRQRVRQHVDPFLGRYVHFGVALQCPSEGTNNIVARCGIWSADEGTSDQLDIILQGTTWQFGSTEFDLSTLANNGDMRGVPGFVEIYLRSTNTFTDVQMTGVRIANGIVTGAGNYLFSQA